MIGCEDIVANSNYIIKISNINNIFQKLNIKQIFDNDYPLELELGMGKGQFINKLALKNRNINFIGIEKYPTVLVKAIDNYEQIYLNEIKNSDNNLVNLKYLCFDVKNLSQIFDKHSIQKIYLNFSDPWPKKRHEHRRLTHKNYLSIYNELLKDKGCIEFKTDNINLFDFSLNELKEFGFIISSYTYDLHNDIELNKANIMTEYEEKFSNKGNKICKLIAERR